MTTLAEVADHARKFTRDFGRFFEVPFPPSPASTTLRLPHPLIDGSSFSVVSNEDGGALTDYILNARHGLVKVPGIETEASGVTVSGLHYEWFLDEDLLFHASLVAHEHIHHRTGVDLHSIKGPEVHVMGIGALVSALWSLATELSTDIDVNSPEGMSIPASQRFTHLMSMIQYWTAEYDTKAAMLNVGLKKIEQFTYRRVSRLTNRYVPIYRGRELDNPRPPVRVRPPVDPIEETGMENEEAYWNQQYPEVQVESSDLGYGGWSSFGWGEGW